MTMLVATNPASAHTADDTVVDAVLQRLGELELVVEKQQALISAQQEQLAALQHDGPVANRQRHSRGRRLTDSSDTAGILIERDNAGVIMGEDSDVAILRTNASELTLAADVVVDGELLLASLEASVDKIILDAQARLDSLEKEQLPCAAMQFPVTGGHSYMTYTAKEPFGADSDGFTVFDYPITAALGYGRLVGGVYTAPTDGIYFMTTELRIADDESDSVEIEFQINGGDTTNFEMWLPTTVKRRTGISAGLFQLKRGDELYAMSDLVPGDGLKGVTTVFKLASDRVAVSAMASGTGFEKQTSLMTCGDESVFFMQPDTLEYADGVFTAPHDSVYLFTIKVRVTDNTSGDMEIEWKKNDADTEGGFEMWLHEGDSSNRRAHMSMMLSSLEAGDTVMATSDLNPEANQKVVFNAFEIPSDSPGFKIYNAEAFEYLEKTTPYGDSVDVEYDFERGSDGAYADGIYTVPEDGFYYFIQKFRLSDGVGDDMGIEWKINGVDAAHNMVMWMHDGDGSGRYSGMSTILVQVVAGDEVSAVSNLDLDASEYITQWTYAGFKVQ